MVETKKLHRVKIWVFILGEVEAWMFCGILPYRHSKGGGGNCVPLFSKLNISVTGVAWKEET